jgi:hypothetical protein
MEISKCTPKNSISVPWKATDVLKEHITPTFRVEEQAKQEVDRKQISWFSTLKMETIYSPETSS